MVIVPLADIFPPAEIFVLAVRLPAVVVPVTLRVLCISILCAFAIPLINIALLFNVPKLAVADWAFNVAPSISRLDIVALP